MTNRVLLIGAAGAIALAVGYLVGRVSQPGGAGATIGVTPSKLQRPDPPQERASVGVNPELLVELRKLGRRSGSHSALGADAFPEVLLRAHSDDDYEATLALLRRWAEIDQQGMVDFFLRQGVIGLQMAARGWLSYEDLVLGLLVEDDPQAAWETALRFPRNQGYRRAVLGVIARDSPDLAVELALQHLDKLQGGGPYFHFGKKANRQLAEALARRVPFGKAEAAALKDVYFADDLEAQLEIWNSLDAEAQDRTAAAFMPQHDDGGEAAGQFYQLLTKRIESGNEGDATVVRRYLDVFSKRLVETRGIADALAWVEQHAAPLGGMLALSQIFTEADQAGVPRAEILDQFDSLSAPSKQQMAGWMTQSLLAKDLPAATEFVAGLPRDQSGVAASNTLGQLMGNRPQQEILSTLLQLPPGLHSDSYLSSVAGGQLGRLGFEKSIEWAEALPADRSQAALGRIISSWAVQQPDAAVEYLAAMPDDAPNREVVVRTVARTQLYAPEEARREWIDGLSSDDRALLRVVIAQSDRPAKWRAEIMAELD
ncbi:MAG: hypothetical protein ACR2RV_00020 [Verrucomicrobiales bacterium]